jgi:ribosomal protein S18 acetylase RimI-like enzyme
MIEYINDISRIGTAQLKGFFVGWPHPPSPEKHLQILRQSYRAILAIDKTSGNVVGFITSISDGVLAAYIPLLEVLPAYQRKGIGGELVGRMLKELEEFYMTDLICDSNLQSFYERFGMRPCFGMIRRNFDRQAE